MEVARRAVSTVGVYNNPLLIASYVSNLLPSTIALVRWRRLDSSQRVLGGLIGFLIVVELASKYYFAPVLQNNMPLHHLYTVAEFTAVGTAYYYAYSSATWRLVVRVLIIAFAGLALANALWWQPVARGEFNTLPRATEALLLLGLAMFYLRQLLDELRIEHLSRHSMFWVTVGVLLYFSSTFWLFAADYWLASALPSGLYDQVWSLNYLGNAVFNLSLTIALWLPSDLPPPRSTPAPS